MKRKVTIVGDGNVGASIAYTFLLRDLVEEVVLIDCNVKKAEADSIDMRDAGFFLGSTTTVRAGDENDYKDSDFIIITASGKMDPNCHDRLDMLKPTTKILSSILPKIKDSGFDGYLILISNPVDVMTYYAYKMTGLDRNKVIGTGTHLDTGRLLLALAEEEKVNARSISGVTMLGEHGSSSVGVFSKAAIGTKPLSIREDKERKEKLLSKTRSLGFDIVAGKGNTSYGIAGCVFSLVKAIVKDENVLLPVSHVLEDGKVAMSLPCIVNQNGIDRVVPAELSKEEQDMLDQSREMLTSLCQAL